ncbi:MAG: hypothetical protein ACLTYN_11825 [Dysosmobacter welbionis]
MTALVASLLLLTACTAPAEKAEGQVPAADAEATDFQERADPARSPESVAGPGCLRAGGDHAGDGLCGFPGVLPVLTGESFRWWRGRTTAIRMETGSPLTPLWRRSMTDTERFEAENPPETLTLDRLAVADIVGGEEPELVLRPGQAIIIWCSTERAERSAAHPFRPLADGSPGKRHLYGLRRGGRQLLLSVLP